MAVFLQPLFQENHHEHGGQDEPQPPGVEPETATEQAAQGGADEPVHMVQEGDEEQEPAPVHIFRDPGGIVDGKGFIAEPENQVELFPAGARL